MQAEDRWFSIGRTADCWANEKHRNWRAHRPDYLDQLFEALWLGAFDGAMRLEPMPAISREQLVSVARTFYWPPALMHEPNIPWDQWARYRSDEYPDPQRRELERVEISAGRLGQWAKEQFGELPLWYEVLTDAVHLGFEPPDDPMDRLREFRREQELRGGKRLSHTELAERAIASGRNEGYARRTLRLKFKEIGPTPLAGSPSDT